MIYFNQDKLAYKIKTHINAPKDVNSTLSLQYIYSALLHVIINYIYWCSQLQAIQFGSKQLVNKPSPLFCKNHQVQKGKFWIKVGIEKNKNGFKREPEKQKKQKIKGQTFLFFEYRSSGDILQRSSSTGLGVGLGIGAAGLSGSFKSVISQFCLLASLLSGYSLTLF